MAIIRTSIQVCTICQSENLVPWAGGISGEMLCKDCGYHGTFIIEKSVDGGEDRMAGLGQKKDVPEEKLVKVTKPSKKAKGKHK
jgi:transcription initiation factor TFIIIB Brf1 subunit/transcription initiation factor TFIIB